MNWKTVDIEGEQYEIRRLYMNDKCLIGQERHSQILVAYVIRSKKFLTKPFFEGNLLFDRLEQLGCMPASKPLHEYEFNQRIYPFAKAELDKVYKPGITQDEIFDKFEGMYGQDNYQAWEDECAMIAASGLICPYSYDPDYILMPNSGTDKFSDLICDMIRHIHSLYETFPETVHT